MKTMSHRKFMNVDVPNLVYGTIRRHRQGESWYRAWLNTYWAIGGKSLSSGRKACPMVAAKTLYEYGRVRDGGLPFRECETGELWNRSRNGAYAILAVRLLRERPALNNSELWFAVQDVVRRETGDEPARSNQGGPTLAFQLWHLDLIVDKQIS